MSDQAAPPSTNQSLTQQAPITQPAATSSTSQPTTNQSATSQPTTSQPTTSQSSNNQPATNQPATNQSSNDQSAQSADTALPSATTSPRRRKEVAPLTADNNVGHFDGEPLTTDQTESNPDHLETNLDSTETSQQTEQEQLGNLAPEQESGSAELEPTIEKLEQEVEQSKVKGPDKVAVRKKTAAEPTPKTVAQPVVVLPLSEQTMKDGAKKSPIYSVKWLVTWAKRQMKKFKDILVVWRDTPYNQK